jgi:hypothetical protein
MFTAGSHSVSGGKTTITDVGTLTGGSDWVSSRGLFTYKLSGPSPRDWVITLPDYLYTVELLTDYLVEQMKAANFYTYINAAESYYLLFSEAALAQRPITLSVSTKQVGDGTTYFYSAVAVIFDAAGADTCSELLGFADGTYTAAVYTGSSFPKPDRYSQFIMQMSDINPMLFKEHLRGVIRAFKPPSALQYVFGTIFKYEPSVLEYKPMGKKERMSDVRVKLSGIRRVGGADIDEALVFVCGTLSANLSFHPNTLAMHM